MAMGNDKDTRQFTVATVKGIAIVLDPSWFLIFLFLTWVLAMAYFPARAPDRSAAAYWLAGALAALSLFVSVVLHELGHSLVAMARKMEVRRIVLFIFGGVSQLQDEPQSPGVEFQMAAIGPAISLALAAVFYGLLRAAEGGAPLLVAYLGYLALINLILAIFNLLPAFPLDGGRVLRAALWARWKDLQRATRVASEVGSGFGTALMLVGGFNVLLGNIIGGLWYLIIGYFLRNAARNSFTQLTFRTVLEGVTVRDIMTPDPLSVDPDTDLGTFVDDYILRYHHPVFPVVESGALVGMVHQARVKSVPREDWPRRKVREVMSRIETLPTLAPEDPAHEAFRYLAATDNRILVRTGTRLEGIISRRDVWDYALLKSDLEPPARGVSGSGP